jgi:hypothetical protein
MQRLDRRAVVAAALAAFLLYALLFRYAALLLRGPRRRSLASGDFLIVLC